MKKEERLQMLQEKLIVMSRYEEALRAKGLGRIAGVDEVGRGPLAGPVVAAALVLPPDFSLLGVDDSKKLSEKKREELFDQILACAVDVSLGVVDNETIDEINILEATRRAMREAIEGLREPPEHVLIDALILREVPIPQTGIVKGDSKSVSIAAASIIAKVTRDRMMRDYHKKYPHYAFDSNKGYGTAAHYAGIKSHGLCPLHRRSFLREYI